MNTKLGMIVEIGRCEWCRIDEIIFDVTLSLERWKDMADGERD